MPHSSENTTTVIGPALYVDSYGVGAAAAKVSFEGAFWLKKMEMARGVNIANEMKYRNTVNNERKIHGYTPKNHMTLTRENSDNQNGSIFSTLIIRYDGPINIGDRIIINEKINNPWNQVFNEAQREYNSIGYWDYLKERGCTLKDAAVDMVCCACCGAFYPCIRCCLCYLGYQEGFKEQCIINSANIKLKLFWEERENTALKKADVLVNQRIAEINRLGTVSNQTILTAFQNHTVASSENQTPQHSIPQNSGQTVWPNYPNSTTAPRPINMV